MAGCGSGVSLRDRRHHDANARRCRLEDGPCRAVAQVALTRSHDTDGDDPRLQVPRAACRVRDRAGAPAIRRTRRTGAAAARSWSRRSGAGGTSRVLVDTSPDLREQLISAKVPALDGVLMTHDHADPHPRHRRSARARPAYAARRIRIYADTPTETSLRQRPGYLFETPPGKLPIRRSSTSTRSTARTACRRSKAPSGPITALPFRVAHGPNYEARGLPFSAVWLICRM